jgi:putative transcriptional regulator
MSDAGYLTNQFLIAMPGLQDPNFHHTVTYICEHSPEGAMGIVVNRPMDLRLEDILEQMQIPAKAGVPVDQIVYVGGPVAKDRGFVLHPADTRWDSTLQIAPEISITTSRDIIEAIAAGNGPTASLIALGYAGWGGGQLESEITQNAWLSSPPDLDILFHMPVDLRWRAAGRLLGVDLDSLTLSAGHA